MGHICTFGEQATDNARLHGLEVLRSVWGLLRDEDAGSDDINKTPRAPTSFLGSPMFSFEIVAGSATPEVKTYVQYGATDRKIAENLAAAFRVLGWQKAADTYLPKLRETFPGAHLDGPSVLHSNLSFAHSKRTGAYMAVYYAVSGKAVDAASRARAVQG